MKYAQARAQLNRIAREISAVDETAAAMRLITRAGESDLVAVLLIEGAQAVLREACAH